MSVGLSRQCERLRERLPEYAEGRLEGRGRARVERHLSQCPRCAAEVEDLRTVIGALRAVGAEETPEDLVARVRRAVQEKVPAPAGVGLSWARLAVPVAVLAALVVVSFALRAPRRQAFVPGGGALESARARSAAEEAETKPAAPAAEEKLGFEIAKKMGAPPYGAGGAPGPRAERPALSEVRKEKPGPSELEVSPPPTPPAYAGARDREERDAALGREKTPSGRLDLRRERAETAGGALRGSAAATPAEPEEHLGAAGRSGGAGGAARGGAGGRREPAVAADVLAGVGAEPSEEAEAPPPPLSARAALVRGEGGGMIALQLAAEEPLGEIALTLGGAPPESYAWEGAAAGPAWVPLPAEKIGSGPAKIPIRLRAAGVSRDYVLFVPTMARLGESAPLAPVGRYEGQSLEAALSEFTALTGLVVLAEVPLDRPMRGEIPRGKPGEALEQLAAEAGFEAHREGDLAYTLTHLR